MILNILMQEQKDEGLSWSGSLFEGLGPAINASNIITHVPDEVREEKKAEPEIIAKDDAALPERIAIVIDANVIIKQIRLRDMLGALDDQDFNSKYEVHTLAEVIKEIKDENARTYLKQLPYELKIHETFGDQENYKFVKTFAKETGDLKSLSWVDTRLMALGIGLTKELGEWDRVKKAPKPLSEFRPKRFEDDYKKSADPETESSSEEQEDEEGQEENVEAED